MVFKISKNETVNKIVLVPFKALFALCLFVSLTLLMIVTALSLSYRFLAKLSAKFLAPNLEGFVDCDSVLFSIDDFSNPSSNVIMYYTCQGQVPIEQAWKTFDERVMEVKDENGDWMYKKLKHHIKTFMGYNFYESDDNFDIRNHIRVYDYDGDLYIPSPCNEDDLRKVVGGLLTKSWKENQSPWEVLLVYNYTSKSQAVGANGDKKEMLAIVLLHHYLGNGLSIAELMQKIATKRVDLPRPSLPERSRWMKILLTAIMPVRIFYDTADSLIENYCGTHPWTKIRKIKKYYTAFTNPIPVEVTKKVKNMHGVSFLSVSLASISGAMHRVMTDVGHHVPERIKIAFTIPNPKQPEGMYNTTFFTFTSLPIEKNTTPENLKRISSKLAELKLSFDTLGFGLLIKCISLMPIRVGRFLKRGFATAVISSFPVFMENGQFDDIDVTDVISTIGPCNSGCGIIVLMCGVAGNQRISVSIDKSLIANEQQFLKIGPYIEEEIMHLYNLGLTDGTGSEKKLDLC